VIWTNEAPEFMVMILLYVDIYMYSFFEKLG